MGILVPHEKHHHVATASNSPSCYLIPQLADFSYLIFRRDITLTEAYRRPFSFIARYLPENKPFIATTPTSTAVISSIPKRAKQLVRMLEMRKVIYSSFSNSIKMCGIQYKVSRGRSSVFTNLSWFSSCLKRNFIHLTISCIIN